MAEAKLKAKGLESQVEELYSKFVDVKDLGDGLVSVHSQYLDEIRGLNSRLSQMQDICAAQLAFNHERIRELDTEIRQVRTEKD